SCVMVHRDYPIHGRYLFDGSEIRLGVNDRFRRELQNEVWHLYEDESELALMDDESWQRAQRGEANIGINFGLIYRDNYFDPKKPFEHQWEFQNRIWGKLPANAAYPANVKEPGEE